MYIFITSLLLRRGISFLATPQTILRGRKTRAAIILHLLHIKESIAERPQSSLLPNEARETSGAAEPAGKLVGGYVYFPRKWWMHWWQIRPARLQGAHRRGSRQRRCLCTQRIVIPANVCYLFLLPLFSFSFHRLSNVSCEDRKKIRRTDRHIVQFYYFFSL